VSVCLSLSFCVGECMGGRPCSCLFRCNLLYHRYNTCYTTDITLVISVHAEGEGPLVSDTKPDGVFEVTLGFQLRGSVIVQFTTILTICRVSCSCDHSGPPSYSSVAGALTAHFTQFKMNFTRKIQSKSPQNKARSIVRSIEKLRIALCHIP
jgi:hypothetical protein